MHLPRRITLFAALFLFIAASAADAHPKSRLGSLPPAGVHRATAKVIQRGAVSDSCYLGIGPAGPDEDVDVLNFILPPDDVYYTLLRPSQCDECAAAETTLFHRVGLSLYFQQPCTLSVVASVHRAIGTLQCPRPDSSTLICPPKAFEIISESGLNFVDAVLDLQDTCRIVGNAFLTLEFTNLSSSCADLAPNPAPQDSAPEVVISLNDCIPCTSYNDYNVTGVFVQDFCNDVDLARNPIMFVEVDSCFPQPDGVPPGRVTDLTPDSLRVTLTSVPLRWTATGDDSLTGSARDYVIKAAVHPLDDLTFPIVPDSIIVPATQAAGGIETAVFGGLSVGTRYWFALQARDEGRVRSLISNDPSAPTARDPLDQVSGPAVVSRIRPARVPVEIFWKGAPDATEIQHIRIYDLTGRLRRDLEVGTGAVGVTMWDGKDDDGEQVTAGVYFARLVTGGAKKVQTRIVLVK